MSLTVKDLEQVQAKFSEAHLDYQLELVDGKIIVMGPSDMVSSEIGAELITVLRNWSSLADLGGSLTPVVDSSYLISIFAPQMFPLLVPNVLNAASGILLKFFQN